MRCFGEALGRLWQGFAGSGNETTNTHSGDAVITHFHAA
jgi:hypothetical protein